MAHPEHSAPHHPDGTPNVKEAINNVAAGLDYAAPRPDRHEPTRGNRLRRVAVAGGSTLLVAGVAAEAVHLGAFRDADEARYLAAPPHRSPNMTVHPDGVGDFQHPVTGERVTVRHPDHDS